MTPVTAVLPGRLSSVHLLSLFWLLPPLLAALPHATHLPPWLSLACGLLWLWRLGLALAGRPMPGTWVRVGLALAAVALVIAQFGLFIGRNGGVPLLVLLLFVKLLEADSQRHQRFALLLAYFVSLSVFLHDQSLVMTVYLLLVAWLITAALVQLQPMVGAKLRLNLLTAGRLLLAGAPLALVLFLFFPRLQAPLWLLPSGEQAARSGLSDSMQPGDFSRLILSGEIAFRASFVGPPPDSATLYWRGPVLSRFDGRVWRAMADQGDLRAPAVGLGNPLSYALTIEPHERQWLFSLGLPATLPAGTRLMAGMQLTSPRPLTQRRRIELTSHPRYRLGATDEELREALALPPGFNPQARALAADWRRADADPQRLLQQGLDLFRRDFAYTLSPPPVGVHSVDEFLFTTRRGFCEHYASAFVFLMRAAGIPARVVTGYLGGEVNPVDGHMVVRQSDAHAWAEVWLADAGWVQVDPTASVSPARVERGLTAALPAVEVPAVLAGLHRPWFRQIRHAWEALNNGWNQWVLGYNLDRQLSLLTELSPHLAGRAWQLTVGVLLAALTLMAWIAWRGSAGREREEAARLYARCTTRLARLGLQREVTEGAQAYARRVAAARPDLAQSVGQICSLYERARYAGDLRALSGLAEATRRFRPRRQPRGER
ncbi:MAG: transglutaminase family protein [Thiobacillaceae bacterium]